MNLYNSREAISPLYPSPFYAYVIKMNFNGIIIDLSNNNWPEVTFDRIKQGVLVSNL